MRLTSRSCNHIFILEPGGMVGARAHSRHRDWTSKQRKYTMTFTFDKVFNAYQAGHSEGRAFWTHLLQSTASSPLNLQAGMRAAAVTRGRCYVCWPETFSEQFGRYGQCDDNLHAVYSAGYFVGTMETLVGAAPAASSDDGRDYLADELFKHQHNGSESRNSHD